VRYVLVPFLPFVLGATVVACGGCGRKSKTDDRANHVPLPAGGAAATNEDDDGGSLVEDAHRYDVKTWSFPLERYELSIEDVGMSTALEPVLRRTNAELAVNAGFFDREGKALGLAISNSAKLAPLAKSLSGGVLTIDNDQARLFPSETVTLPEGIRFAIQCRPRLVVDGAPNVKRDDGKRSERTALCLRDGGKTIDVFVVREQGSADEAGPSLFALGKFLARRGCEGALNLDGGPSTGVAWKEGEEVRVQGPRGPIRHAIVFRKK
jgi:uncharacterized protein YigE (DUF2233 family)